MFNQELEKEEEQSAPVEEDGVLDSMLGTAGEPGNIKGGTVLSTGKDSREPIPSIVSAVESAGYTTIYNRRSGQTSVCNNNNLPNTLRKVYTDGPHQGEIVFTMRDPGVRPPKGRFPCYLHPDGPKIAGWDEFAGQRETCPGSSYITEYHRDRHMARKHKDEWAQINRLRSDADRKEWEKRDEDERKERTDLLRILAGKTVTMETETKTEE